MLESRRMRWWEKNAVSDLWHVRLDGGGRDSKRKSWSNKSWAPTDYCVQYNARSHRPVWLVTWRKSGASALRLRHLYEGASIW